jgi:hypothetical protein
VSEMANFERKQRDLCSRYGCEFVGASEDSILGVALSTLGKFPINGLRHRMEKGTNGWYIWCGASFDDRSDFFAPLHTSHLAEKCPVAILFLGLPPGYRFLIGENDYVDVWFDANLLRC